MFVQKQFSAKDNLNDPFRSFTISSTQIPGKEESLELSITHTHTHTPDYITEANTQIVANTSVDAYFLVGNGVI